MAHNAKKQGDSDSSYEMYVREKHNRPITKGEQMNRKPEQWWKDQWNPLTGCNKISEACQHCYALAMLNRFSRGQQKEGDLRYYPDRMTKPFDDKKPRRYFVGNMTDIFHPSHPQHVVNNMLMIMRRVERHTYMILTKRPNEFLKRFSFPIEDSPNIWFLVTAENQARFDERSHYLEQIPAAVRGISAEPLLGPIVLGPAAKWLSWVIVGGENGPGARASMLRWYRDLRDQCLEANIPFWLKGFGYKCVQFDPETFNYPRVDGGPNNRTLDGKTWDEIPMTRI